MLESISIFITAYIFAWPGLIALYLIGTLFDHNEATGWAVFTAFVIGVISLYTYSVPWPILMIGFAAYLVTGIIWSFWRYKRHINSIVEKIRETTDNHRRQYYANSSKPSAMLNTITAWIIIWPFSVVSSIIGDFIDAVHTLVTKVFKGVYVRIYKSVLDEFEKKDK